MRTRLPNRALAAPCRLMLLASPQLEFLPPAAAVHPETRHTGQHPRELPCLSSHLVHQFFRRQAASLSTGLDALSVESQPLWPATVLVGSKIGVDCRRSLLASLLAAFGHYLTKAYVRGLWPNGCRSLPRVNRHCRVIRLGTAPWVMCIEFYSRKSLTLCRTIH
jgi:hypothetical protein